MTNTIRNVKSTLNLFLAMLELFISVMLAIKIFQADVASENGLARYILECLGLMDSGATWLVDSSEMTGGLSFLLVVLIFMIFSQTLFLAAPKMVERRGENSAGSNRRQALKYGKKRFNKNRFFKKQNSYYRNW